MAMEDPNRSIIRKKRKTKRKLPPEYQNISTARMEHAADQQSFGSWLGTLLGGLTGAFGFFGGPAVGIPTTLAGASLGNQIGGAIGGEDAVAAQADYYAQQAQQEYDMSKWAVLEQMEAEEEARQAAIDFSFKEMINANTKKTSPEHTFKASNWRNA